MKYTGWALVGTGLATVFILFWLIVVSPGEEIRPENIQKILAVESPVLYSDGLSKIGVFFEEAHRQYIPYKEIPEAFINAIVAAEDHTFFEHFGIDISGILRAMAANLKAGRVVQGGSTITQQTAKNLFKRKDRSIWAKIKELIYALRLEYHFSKEQILEFYCNQFYVSGNGRGLGVAARYYFDKEVDELDLQECAFIAGSVKKPNYYNPFIKPNEQAADKARASAKARAAYVLKQMYALGKITLSDYQQYSGKELDFKQGKMFFSTSTVMDLVKTAIEHPMLEEMLRDHGIDNVATSGIRIITTIDRGVQFRAQLALRKELSSLDIRLAGYDRKQVQTRYAEKKSSDRGYAKGTFHFGKIVEIDEQALTLKVQLSSREKKGRTGIITRAGLMPVLSALVKYHRNRWSEPTDQDWALLFGQLKKGDLIYYSIADQDAINDIYQLEMEKYPTLQGAVLVLKDGVIHTMIGGNENRFYNRAVHAKRPLGSVFKPLVYTAAQQLGWSSIDMLNNARNLFLYQNEPYFPRPDHKSPFEQVSMSWAGVDSENVATVWLLYHLCDRLSPAQFKEVVSQLDLARRDTESENAYIRRIRDEHGVMVDTRALYQAAFKFAVQEMEADLIFAGRLDEYEALRTFHYASEDVVIDEEDDSYEADVRRSVLKKSFVRLKEMVQGLDLLRHELEVASGFSLETNLYMQEVSKENGRIERNFIYTSDEPRNDWQRVSWFTVRALLKAFAPHAREKFWQEILIDGFLPAGVVRDLDQLVEKQYQRLRQLSPYSPDVLYNVNDFRVLCGLYYVVDLCRELGIDSRLEPVLSFPLGSNVVSLLEAARAYEGIVKGNVWDLADQQDAGLGLYLIDRIENSDGEIIFTPKFNRRRVVSPQISLMISDILKNVVEYGTGRYAKANVTLHSKDPAKEEYLASLDLRVPVLGKTGTANRFTNSSFVGVVPGPGDMQNEVSVESGYSLAAYIGYDDNEPMVRNTTHITGAAGALPVWTRVANAILFERNVAAGMDVVDLSFSGVTTLPLHFPDLGQIYVPVDENGGGKPVRDSFMQTSTEDAYAQVLVFGTRSSNDEIEPERFFQPFWKMRLGMAQ